MAYPDEESVIEDEENFNPFDNDTNEDESFDLTDEEEQLLFPEGDD